MEWGVKLLAAFQRMKEKMDRMWNSLSEVTPSRKNGKYGNGSRSFQNSKGEGEGA